MSIVSQAPVHGKEHCLKKIPLCFDSAKILSEPASQKTFLNQAHLYNLQEVLQVFRLKYFVSSLIVGKTVSS